MGSRRFSSSQRAALYLASGGKCSHCGCELQPGFHADHRVPYSAGGGTDVSNGDATCPKCNLHKGARLNRDLKHWSRQLRQWQQNAFADYVAKAQRDYLLVATPGGGKTTAALRIAHSLVADYVADRIVVVVPTENLKRQWHDAAADVGIFLQPDWQQSDGASEVKDFHGMVVTYQAVFNCPSLMRQHCGKQRTVVVLDEIHHVGDGNAWGDALSFAFEPAIRRLCLSGTPFRSDNNKIPFVRYESGESKADFPYSYADALTDDVVRPVLFPTYEGRMEWVVGDQVFEASFRDELSDQDKARRLRTAVASDGEWLPHVLSEANRRLDSLRADGHTDAAGLVLCIDEQHARAVAKLLRDAVVVVSADGDEAHRAIEAFKSGDARWIVSIRMVSEGVDIPRLRVLVYATITRTELFFRQAVGRIVRMLRGFDDQTAYFYMPEDPDLVEFARRIKEEQAHQIDDELERLKRELSELPEQQRNTFDFMPISSEAERSSVISDGDMIAVDELNEAERLARLAGIPAGIHIEHLAKFMRQLKSQLGVQPAERAQREEKQESPHRIRQRLRKVVDRLVKRLAAVKKEEHRDVNNWVAKKIGAYRTQATVEQLEKAVQCLEAELRGGGDGIN